MDLDDLDELIRTGSEGKCDRGYGAEWHADVFILKEGFPQRLKMMRSTKKTNFISFVRPISGYSSMA